MAQDGRDILEVLKFELNFLQDGGYGRSPRTPWRAPSIFEDSPVCPNFCDPSHAQPCESCLLAKFVPENLRSENVPCRLIPLTEDGRTVDDFYRTASQAEMEAALAVWLRREIKRIEQERGLTPKEGAA